VQREASRVNRSLGFRVDLLFPTCQLPRLDVAVLERLSDVDWLALNSFQISEVAPLSPDRADVADAISSRRPGS
jgi:hypothetical protein